MTDDISDLTPMLDRETDNVLHFSNSNKPSRATQFRNAITMTVLFLINLLNYMDRFAIADWRYRSWSSSNSICL
jgi:hypothetical protein